MIPVFLIHPLVCALAVCFFMSGFTMDLITKYTQDADGNENYSNNTFVSKRESLAFVQACIPPSRY